MEISPRTLFRNFVSSLAEAWTKCNEIQLGIRTEPERREPQHRVAVPGGWKGEFSGNARYTDNFHYVSIGYGNIRKMLQIVKPGPADVFYDVGCGMGRILCMVARQPVRGCVGVELLEPLCDIANQNAMKLRGRKAPIQVICGDATTSDLSGGTIYFLNNPFGADTLRDTLTNIRRAVPASLRPVRIVYYNSTFEPVLAESGWLTKIQEFNSSRGHRVTIWQSRGERAEQATPPRQAETIPLDERLAG